MISAHLIAALLIGEGAVFVSEMLRAMWQGDKRQEAGDKQTRDKQTMRQGDRRILRIPISLSPNLLVSPSFAGLALLLLPVLLLARNLPAIRAANTGLPDLAARATLAQPLPTGALLLIDWDAVEPLRYLQEIEGVRADVEVRPLNIDVARQDADAGLRAGRAVYLLHALPNLGLAQSPEGRLWRIGDRPLNLRANTPTDQRWRDGIALKGFTLPPGPYRPGEIVPITLEWQAYASPSAGYVLFAHVVGADGAPLAQQDRPPAAPTEQWRPGAQVLDLYGPTLRLDTPPGRYQVLIGWYAYPSLDRLPLEGDATDSYTLGEIEVVPLR
jgi:hypothetical protein